METRITVFSNRDWVLEFGLSIYLADGEKAFAMDGLRVCSMHWASPASHPLYGGVGGRGGLFYLPLREKRFAMDGLCLNYAKGT